MLSTYVAKPQPCHQVVIIANSTRGRIASQRRFALSNTSAAVESSSRGPDNFIQEQSNGIWSVFTETATRAKQAVGNLIPQAPQKTVPTPKSNLESNQTEQEFSIVDISNCLVPVSTWELKVLRKLSNLTSLCYKLNLVTSHNLRRLHRLKLVTSSLGNFDKTIPPNNAVQKDKVQKPGSAYLVSTVSPSPTITAFTLDNATRPVLTEAQQGSDYKVQEVDGSGSGVSQELSSASVKASASSQVGPVSSPAAPPPSPAYDKDKVLTGPEAGALFLQNFTDAGFNGTAAGQQRSRTDVTPDQSGEIVRPSPAAQLLGPADQEVVCGTGTSYKNAGERQQQAGYFRDQEEVSRDVDMRQFNSRGASTSTSPGGTEALITLEAEASRPSVAGEASRVGEAWSWVKMSLGRDTAVSSLQPSSVPKPLASSVIEATSSASTSSLAAAAPCTESLPSSSPASMASSKSAAAGAAPGPGSGPAIAADPAAQPSHWFVVDDERLRIRFFVIQGSDSWDHWRLNLTVDPTPFEDVQGVKVHKGVYRAAQVLLAQVLPLVRDHLRRGGPGAKVSFTGHSIGGSLATLLVLMLRRRGELRAADLTPVYTFGAPAVFCRSARRSRAGGAVSETCMCGRPPSLMQQLGLPEDAVRNVMTARDTVPRAFACDFSLISDFLRGLNGALREHGCLTRAAHRHIYYPVGSLIVLQLDSWHSFVGTDPYHPMLPLGPGAFYLREPTMLAGIIARGRAAAAASATATNASGGGGERESLLPLHAPGASSSSSRSKSWSPRSASSSGGGGRRQDARARRMARSVVDATWALMNCPHPFRTVADPSAYLASGIVSRYHNPENYTRGLGRIIFLRRQVESTLAVAAEAALDSAAETAAELAAELASEAEHVFKLPHVTGADVAAALKGAIWDGGDMSSSAAVNGHSEGDGRRAGGAQGGSL